MVVADLVLAVRSSASIGDCGDGAARLFGLFGLFALGDLVDLFLHLDQHLNEWAGVLGPWLYVVLFAIVFCETGLVVTPFLPGDSLLFAVGRAGRDRGLADQRRDWSGSSCSSPACSATPSTTASAIASGRACSPGPTRRIFNREHLLRTQHFYEKYGGKTIFLARFVPIIRTFAPFVAGVGRMSYPRFAMFNVTGAFTWVTLFLFGGYWFGNLPVVARQLLAGDPRHHRALAAADRDRVPEGASERRRASGAAGSLTRRQAPCDSSRAANSQTTTRTPSRRRGSRRELVGERLARGRGTAGVAHDAVDRQAELERQPLGEAGAASPAEIGLREDGREAVAQEQHRRPARRPPAERRLAPTTRRVSTRSRSRRARRGAGDRAARRCRRALDRLWLLAPATSGLRPAARCCAQRDRQLRAPPRPPLPGASACRLRGRSGAPAAALRVQRRRGIDDLDAGGGDRREQLLFRGGAIGAGVIELARRGSRRGWTA